MIEALRRTVPPGALITAPEELRTYECDGLTGHQVVPAAVVLPESTEQVAACVRVCHRAGVPFVARGSGTGLFYPDRRLAITLIKVARTTTPNR